jgi:hypothetical protein
MDPSHPRSTISTHSTQARPDRAEFYPEWANPAKTTQRGRAQPHDQSKNPSRDTTRPNPTSPAPSPNSLSSSHPLGLPRPGGERGRHAWRALPYQPASNPAQSTVTGPLSTPSLPNRLVHRDARVLRRSLDSRSLGSGPRTGPVHRHRALTAPHPPSDWLPATRRYSAGKSGLHPALSPINLRRLAICDKFVLVTLARHGFPLGEPLTSVKEFPTYIPPRRPQHHHYTPRTPRARSRVRDSGLLVASIFRVTYASGLKPLS